MRCCRNDVDTSLSVRAGDDLQWMGFSGFVLLFNLQLLNILLTLSSLGAGDHLWGGDLVLQLKQTERKHGLN